MAIEKLGAVTVTASGAGSTETPAASAPKDDGDLSAAPPDPTPNTQTVQPEAVVGAKVMGTAKVSGTTKVTGNYKDIWTADGLLNLVTGKGLTTEDYDLSVQRKRTRYFGLLGIFLAVSFCLSVFGLFRIFNAAMDIISVPCCLLSDQAVMTKLKVLAPLTGTMIVAAIGSLFILARISQQPKKNDEPIGEIPSLFVELIKSAIGWLRKKD